MDSECCDGTGFADYAAVPCPNPKCPVMKKMGEDNRRKSADRGDTERDD